MRPAAVLLLAAFAAGAEDYVFEDPFWNLAFRAPGLEKSLPGADAAVLFRGRCAGGVKVELSVQEGDEVLPPAEWTRRIRAEWEKAGRKPEGIEEADGLLLFREKRLGVIEEVHGYAIHARGHHGFVVHAVGGDEAAVKKAAAGLSVGKDEGAGLLARRIALRAGRDPRDPAVLLEAGTEYVRTSQRALAAGLLARARRTVKEDALTAEQTWLLYEVGGLALADAPEEAIDWHRRAEEAAGKLEEKSEERRAQSAYNLACACSRAKRIDEGFEAIRRAYAKTKPVTDGHLSDDKDLDNLRRDERWHAFWKDLVAER